MADKMVDLIDEAEGHLHTAMHSDKIEPIERISYSLISIANSLLYLTYKSMEFRQNED